MNHIFIHVLDRTEDVFSGIRKQLMEEAKAHTIKDVRLCSSDYARIRRVEYTWRRHLRLFYYRRIYRRLSTRILSALEKDDQNIAYIADEGVWGLLLKHTLSHTENMPITINVQHGFFETLEENARKHYHFRKAINRLLSYFLGGPLFGLGVGGAELDIYLCYSEQEKAWLRQKVRGDVYICPQLIKHNFIERYQACIENNDASKAVFLLPADVPGSSFRCSLAEFLETLSPMIFYLIEERGMTITLRRHPGDAPDSAAQKIQKSIVGTMVQIDERDDIARTLADNPVVFSAHSTGLFEAKLVDRCAIGIASRCYNHPIYYLDRIVDLTCKEWKDQIDHHLRECLSTSNNQPANKKTSLSIPSIVEQRLQR